MKLFFELILTVLTLLLSIPLIFLTLQARRKLGGSSLLRKRRLNFGIRPFEMIKFLVMTGERNSTGLLLLDADRLTPSGRFLHTSSLDELPELWCVLRGNMRLVSPRPLLMEYLPLYSAEQSRRHDVRSGITGWAQVNGRNALSWEEKFKLDLWYVDSRSTWLDIRILGLTVRKVMMRDGISAAGVETMSRFTRSLKESKR